MNRRIALSGLSILAALGLIGGATFAFFNDVETSTGNVFQAGALDLKIDNVSYYNGHPSEITSWQLDDLARHLFFNFDDVKPGDIGEDTISLHVNNNDAWACMSIKKTKNDDVTCTTPELLDDITCDDPDPDTTDGDLAQALNFIFWADDGDNVLEQNETIFKSGSANDLFDGAPGKSWVLADSAQNIWDGSGPLQTKNADHSDRIYYIGKAWCFGALTENRVPTGEGVNPMVNPGIKCDGTLVNNAAQTDMLMADVTFTAEQARNNRNFLCNPN